MDRWSWLTTYGVFPLVSVLVLTVGLPHFTCETPLLSARLVERSSGDAHFADQMRSGYVLNMTELDILEKGYRGLARPTGWMEVWMDDGDDGTCPWTDGMELAKHPVWSLESGVPVRVQYSSTMVSVLPALLPKTMATRGGTAVAQEEAQTLGGCW